MPDPSMPPGLPAPRVRPTFPADEAQLDLAVRRGRHRRAVTGTATGAALLLIPAVLYASSGSGPQREDSLIADQPTPAPRTTAQALPVPDAQPSGESPDQVLQPVPAASATRPAAPAAPPPAEQRPQDEPAAPNQPEGRGASPDPAGTSRTFTVTRDTVAYTADSCQYSPGTGAAAGWCIGSPGAFSTQEGQPVQIRQLLCRVPASGSRDATFPRAREVEFHIYDGQSRTRWKSSRDLRRSEHSITVAPSTCVRWTVTWDARDDAGEILPAGNYSLENTIDANLSGINQSEAYAFPYDFTVTK